MQEDRYSESLRKRAEVSTMVNNEGKVTEGAKEEEEEEPPIRAVRKRHHTLTQGDNTIITPLLRMPPTPIFPNQNVTVFQMLRQFDKFES